jgi:transposase
MSRKNKYTKSFKFRAVQYVLKNNLGVTHVCDKFGVSKRQLRTWINYYKLYGVSGLEPRIKNSKYSFDFKLMVLNDIEELGLSISEAALKYNVPSNTTVRNWLRIYNTKGALELSKELRGRPNTMDKKIKKKQSKKPLSREEELLLENESLKAELALLKKLDALAQAKKKNQ